MTLSFLIVIIFVSAWAIWTYNRIIALKNQVAAAWSDIDVQLQRRFDLVPNLINVVKGYCDHERETLESVARRWSADEQPKAAREQQENHLSAAMGRLIAVAEDYPQLWASDQFKTLHRSLVEVEDYIQYARRYYNGSVRDYNVRIHSFPDVVLAKFFSMKEADFFEVESALQRQAPEVQLT